MITMKLKDRATAFIRNEPDLAREIARQLSKASPLGLTARQSELLGFIRDYASAHGHAPSYEQMMDGMGLTSKASIHRIVTALEERGHISRIPNQGRSISLKVARAAA